MPTTKQDLVVIRVSKNDPSDVFALFPTIPFDNTGRYCTSYQHIGQHGGADYHGCIASSRPATAEEAAPLLAELRTIGYNPKVLRRASYRHRAQLLANSTF